MIPFYSTESVEIYNVNCLDWMRQQSDSTIDLTLTSPPYDNIRNYKGYSFDFEPIARELWSGMWPMPPSMAVKLALACVKLFILWTVVLDCMIP